MAIRAHFFRGLVVTVMAAAVSACGSTGSSVPATGPVQQSPLSALSSPRHVLPSKSWMAPDAKTSQLLYLSDGNASAVYVYSWPQLKLRGTLSGIDVPVGMCSDKTGNVWITNLNKGSIGRYAHGSLLQSRYLRDLGQLPVSCAVDPITGDLAVGNLETSGSGQGSVAIYKGAAGKPALFYDGFLNRVYFMDYDPQGNLFVDGQDSAGNVQLDEFTPKHTFKHVALTGATIQAPGGVQYADGSLTIGDEQGTSGYGVIYQITESGVVTGSTQLQSGASCFQYTIAKTRVMCPDILDHNYQEYSYPPGGTATKTITGSFGTPYGSAISQ